MARMWRLQAIQKKEVPSKLKSDGPTAKGKNFVSSGMNKTEERYARYLDERIKRGEVVDYLFEKYKIKIAEHTCWYTPDFAVRFPDGEVQFHEVKGARAIFTDDAKVKVKCCADNQFFKVFVVYPKKDGGWEIEPY